MIWVQAPRLEDYAYVAERLTADSRDDFREIAGVEYKPDDVAATFWLMGGRRWTFWESVERYAVAVGGYMPHQDKPGVWCSWFMSTDMAWQKPTGQRLTEAVARVVRSMFDDSEVQRLETVTLATRTRARAWYERIGLTYEATACKASANGLDLVTYVAVRK